MQFLILSFFTFSLSYGQNQAKTYREQSANVDRIKIVGLRGSLRIVSQPKSDQLVAKITHVPGTPLALESVRREGRLLVLEIQPLLGAWSEEDLKSGPAYAIELAAPDQPLEVYWHEGETTIDSWRSQIFLTQQSGKIRVTGGEGDTRVSLRTGQLTLSNRRGRAQAETYNTTLSARDLEGDFSVDNFSGTSEISRVSGEISLSGFSGQMRVIESMGGLEYRLEKTALTAAFAGAVRGSSGQGNVQLEVTAPLDVRLKARLGRVSVKLPESSGASVRVESKEGELTLPSSVAVKRRGEWRTASGDLPGGGGGFVSVKTESASVRIR